MPCCCRCCFVSCLCYVRSPRPFSPGKYLFLIFLLLGRFFRSEHSRPSRLCAYLCRVLSVGFHSWPDKESTTNNRHTAGSNLAPDYNMRPVSDVFCKGSWGQDTVPKKKFCLVGRRPSEPSKKKANPKDRQKICYPLFPRHHAATVGMRLYSMLTRHVVICQLVSTLYNLSNGEQTLSIIKNGEPTNAKTIYTHPPDQLIDTIWLLQPPSRSEPQRMPPRIKRAH